MDLYSQDLQPDEQAHEVPSHPDYDLFSLAGSTSTESTPLPLTESDDLLFAEIENEVAPESERVWNELRTQDAQLDEEQPIGWLTLLQRSANDALSDYQQAIASPEMAPGASRQLRRQLRHLATLAWRTMRAVDEETIQRRKI